MRNSSSDFWSFFFWQGFSMFLLTMLSAGVGGLLQSLLGIPWTYSGLFVTATCNSFIVVFISELMLSLFKPLKDSKIDKNQSSEQDLKNPDDEDDLWK